MDEDYEEQQQQQEDDETDAPRELTEAQKAHIREMYEKFDLNKSGTLSSKELRKALQVLGMNPTLSEVKDIMEKYNMNDNLKAVSLEDFENILTQELIAHCNPEVDLLEAFRLFDKDKNGTLDVKELKMCLQSLGEQLSDEEVTDLFNQLDTNNDGKLSYMELVKILA